MATVEYMTSQTYSATIGGVVYNVTAAVGGTMDYSTDKTFGGNVTVQGNLVADAITGPTTITGATTVTGALSATGNVTAGGVLIVGSQLLQILQYNGSPSGAATAPKGSLACDYANGKLYINTDGGTTWAVVGTQT